MTHQAPELLATSAPPVKRSRSRAVCKRCHDRRTRCDLYTTGVPCSGCKAARLDDDCQLLVSKRSRGHNGRFSSRRVVENEGQITAVCSPGEAFHDQPFPTTPDPSLQNRSQAQRTTTVVDEPEPSDSGSTLTLAPSESDSVWSKVVSHYHPDVPDGRRVMYVGEQWTLAYVMRWKDPPSGASEDTVSGTSAASPTGIHVSMPIEDNAPSPAQKRVSPLVTELTGQAELPARIQQGLIDSYFTRNHRLYPIVNERDLRSSYQSGTISPVLLHSILYAAALHAPDAIIYRAGFDSRQACLLSLYRRAKTAYMLHDDDGTADQLSSVQAAFLLHNMWQAPTATMDPWTWLGLAIRTAQNIGMHRSTKQSALKDADKRLWKRIWWCLYVSSLRLAGTAPTLITRKISNSLRHGIGKWPVDSENQY